MDPAHHGLHRHRIPRDTEPRTCFLEPDLKMAVGSHNGTDHREESSSEASQRPVHRSLAIQVGAILYLLAIAVHGLPGHLHRTSLLNIGIAIALLLNVCPQCLTYISLSGILAGVDRDLSFYLLSIANACSLIGRLGGGLAADRFGE